MEPLGREIKKGILTHENTRFLASTTCTQPLLFIHSLDGKGGWNSMAKKFRGKIALSVALATAKKPKIGVGAKWGSKKLAGHPGSPGGLVGPGGSIGAAVSAMTMLKNKIDKNDDEDEEEDDDFEEDAFYESGDENDPESADAGQGHGHVGKEEDAEKEMTIADIRR
jgi:hypothetical protein